MQLCAGKDGDVGVDLGVMQVGIEGGTFFTCASDRECYENPAAKGTQNLLCNILKNAYDNSDGYFNGAKVAVVKT